MSNPPYTKEFLISYRQRFVEAEKAKVLADFVNSVTKSVLAAAKQGLSSYTVREIPVVTQFQQAMNALKVNFPDSVVKLINIPTPQARTSVPAILISWL